jgi:hypothetical protein
MLEPVYPEMASLAARQDVRRDVTWGIAGADVGNGQPDRSLRPERRVMMPLHAAPSGVLASVQAALSATLALAGGASEPDLS